MGINLFILECKFIVRRYGHQVGQGINLFILECKFVVWRYVHQTGQVLIFSYWNVNKNPSYVNSSELVGINLFILECK